MNISCTPISLSKTFREEGMDVERYIGYCAEQGMDAVDLLDSVGYPWQWKDLRKEMKAIPSWLQKSGLKLAAFACGNNFTKKSEVEFTQQVDVVKNALCEASALGAPVLRIFGGKNPCCGGELRIHEAMKRVMEGIEKCLPEAEKNNVVIAIENHGCLPGHSYEIESIITHFKSQFVKCTFDCANFLANNMDETENPLDAYERLGPHIAHVHFKDFRHVSLTPPNRVEACLTGQGIVPLRQLAALMERSGYAGCCSLEYEAGSSVPEKDGIPQCIEYMKEIRRIHSVLGEYRGGH